MKEMCLNQSLKHIEDHDAFCYFVMKQLHDLGLHNQKDINKK